LDGKRNKKLKDGQHGMLSLKKSAFIRGGKTRDGCAAGQSIWIARRDTNAYVLLAGFRAHEWQGLMALPGFAPSHAWHSG